MNAISACRWCSGTESSGQCRRHKRHRWRKRHRFNPRVGRILWRRKCNPLQYSCLENPMDRGAWRATVPGVTKGRTQLFTHAFIQETTPSSLVPPATWGHKERSVTWKRAPTWPCWHPELRLPASRAVSSALLLFTSRLRYELCETAVDLQQETRSTLTCVRCGAHLGASCPASSALCLLSPMISAGWLHQAPYHPSAVGTGVKCMWAQTLASPLSSTVWLGQEADLSEPRSPLL